MDKNFINNTILILILLLLANYLSNGSIITILKKYYQLLMDYLFSKTEGFQGIFSSNKEATFEGIKPCKYTTPEIMHDTEFKYVFNEHVKGKGKSQVEEPEMKKLYHFLQSLVSTNRNINELTPSNSNEINLSQAEKDNLRQTLTKSLNCNKEFKFINIEFIDKLVYFTNNRGKEIKPFRFTTDASINNVPLGKLTIYLEMFIRMDDLFYGPIKSGFPTITRIKLTHRGPAGAPEPHDFDKRKYDKDTTTDNSLIPDSVHFSTDIMDKDRNTRERCENEESSITIPDIETTSELVTTYEN
jgi:hypothetical protein